MSERYIVIPKWERFQHYKNRRPPWIKNYLELRDNTAYLRLTPNRRALLHGLWMEYAARCSCDPLERDLTCTCLVLDLKMINRSLHLDAKMSDLEALRKAGFVTLPASRRLAKRKQVVPLEVEREKETPLSPLGKTNGMHTKGPCPECRVGAGFHAGDCSRAQVFLGRR